MFPAVHNKCKSEQVKFSYKTASRKHEDTLSTFTLVCFYMYMPVCAWIIRLGGGCIYPLSHLTAWNIPQKYDWSKTYVKPGFLFIFFFFFFELKVKEKSHVVLGLGPGLSVHWASTLQQTSLPGRSLWACHYSVLIALRHVHRSVNQVLLVPVCLCCGNECLFWMESWRFGFVMKLVSMEGALGDI